MTIFQLFWGFSAHFRLLFDFFRAFLTPGPRGPGNPFSESSALSFLGPKEGLFDPCSNVDNRPNTRRLRICPGVTHVPDRQVREEKVYNEPKLVGPDIFGWSGGLPRERVGAKKLGMSSTVCMTRCIVKTSGFTKGRL